MKYSRAPNKTFDWISVYDHRTRTSSDKIIEIIHFSIHSFLSYKGANQLNKRFFFLYIGINVQLSIAIKDKLRPYSINN